MCTLILGRDVVAPGTVLLGANRDEDPKRPSDPPRVLRAEPRLVGGRDRVAGGSWLAVRERRAVLAMLNRRADVASPAERRSRGQLTLEVAAAPDTGDLSQSAVETARNATTRDVYSPFSLLFASPSDCWVLSGNPSGPPRIENIGAGWHVITHADLDDPGEPRTAMLLAGLRDWKPLTLEEAERGLWERLRGHGDGATDSAPAVCIHAGTMRTVSSALVWLSRGQSRYMHVEGRPCETQPMDYTPLLANQVGAQEKP